MATIVTRAGKGLPLTNAELDANFTNLNDQLATALFGANNLSDLANVSTARSNLGLAIGTDVQAWDADLDAIAALSGTSGLLKKTAANTWSLDTTVYANTAGTYADPSWITSLASSKLTGTIATARLGTGTADATTFLRGDNTWQVVSVPVTSVFGRTGAVTLGSSDVTGALGFTPYNATNPSGYITSSALSSYLPLTGGTLTGALTVNGGDLKTYRAGGTTGVLYLDSAGSHYIYWDGTQYNLPSGNMILGGSFTASGNVTAYSDERLKADWGDLADDFITRLAGLKHGTYTRTDSGERQVGVSAQGLRAFMPEAVIGDDTLSVAYGNASLVACVRLAMNQISMQARLDKLEQKVLA